MNKLHQSSGKLRRPTPSRPRRRRRPEVEPLEDRLTPANLDISAAGAATFTANPGELNDVTLRLNQLTGRYEFTEAGSNPVITVSGAGAAGADAQGAGTNQVTALSAFITSIAIDTDDLADFVRVASTAVPTTVTTAGAGSDTVTIGDAGSVQGITAAVTVMNPDSLSTLVVDDSADPTGRAVTMSEAAITGLAPAAINYNANEIGNTDPTLPGLTVNGGTGADTFTVTNTIFSTITELNAGGGNDTVNVLAGSAGSTLNVNGQGGNDFFRVVPSPDTATVTFNFDGGPPTAGSGDVLDYRGNGTVTPSGTGAGTITQTGVNPVTFAGIESTLVGPGALQFNGPTFVVGENGAFAVITVTRTGGAFGPVSATFTAGGGTAVPGQDFTPTTTTVTLGDDVTSQTVTVPILNDQLVEPNKTVNLALSNPTGGATLGTPSTAVLTIFDNDFPVDVTGLVKVVLGKLQGTKKAKQKVTLTNRSGRTLAGLVLLFLDGLNPKIKLTNLAVLDPNGSPGFILNRDIAPGASASGVLKFNNPKLKRIKFRVRVIALGGLL
jgi:hypothetical protein